VRERRTRYEATEAASEALPLLCLLDVFSLLKTGNRLRDQLRSRGSIFARLQAVCITVLRRPSLSHERCPYICMLPWNSIYAAKP
jgi:hypothetical protein